jgi:hypothetical protein
MPFFFQILNQMKTEKDKYNVGYFIASLETRLIEFRDVLKKTKKTINFNFNNQTIYVSKEFGFEMIEQLGQKNRIDLYKILDEELDNFIFRSQTRKKFVWEFSENVVDVEIIRKPIKTERPMQIFAKYDRNILLYADPNDSVETLKSQIYNKIGIPEIFQKLTYAGKQIQNGVPIREYDIDEHATIHISTSCNNSAIEVTFDDRDFEISLENIISKIYSHIQTHQCNPKVITSNILNIIEAYLHNN